MTVTWCRGREAPSIIRSCNACSAENRMCIDNVVYIYLASFFFFQAEDGIRDLTVTGVQTCALPISLKPKMLGCNGVNCEKTREPDPLLSWVIRMNRLVGRRRLNPAPPFGGTEWHTLGRAYELPHLPELKIRIHQLRSDTSRGRRTANRFCSSASWCRNDAQLHSPSTRALEIE